MQLQIEELTCTCTCTHKRYCSKATSQTHATFLRFTDLRVRNELRVCISGMRTCLDFRLPYMKMNSANKSSTTGYKYIYRFIRKRLFFVTQA